MNCEIISIGDEILIGQITNTNAQWMATQLNLAGIPVVQLTTIGDNKEEMLRAFAGAEKRADIILITGGLGPTSDDFTKPVLCEYFNSRLVFNEECFGDVKKIFEGRDLPMLDVNRRQAEVPENCIPIRNKNGTAPGMWFEERKKIFVAMPGVPYEMKAMMSGFVLPMLKEKFRLPAIYHRTVLTQGMGESFLAERIASWERSLNGIRLAYLPSPGMVRLRLSASGNDAGQLKKMVDAKVTELQRIIPELIYGYENYGAENETLEKIAGDLLRKNSKTLSTAESCTGGYLAHLVTSVAGSSDYFKGSIVSYANEIKMSELGVKKETLDSAGAVSKETAEQMALGAKKKFGTDYAIAITGIAGPVGGTKEKPVGTVWISIATPSGIVSEKFVFGDNRERNIRRTSLTALNMLRKELLK